MAKPNKTLARRLYMELTRQPVKYLPFNRWGDRLSYLHAFYVQHHRWPTRRFLFNDVLYQIKSGPEIESPERMFTSDKEFVKAYIAGTVGEQYNVPTLGVLRTEDDIQNAVFDQPCIIKPTHGSGGVTFVHPDETVDRDALCSHLKQDFYPVFRERNYRLLKRKLIVEPILFQGQNVNDYKVFCWNGDARCILYVNDRNRAFYRLMFDRDWNSLPIDLSPFDVDKPVPDRPLVLEEMLSVAETLAKPFGLVRVDFYIENNRLLVGEITHCHQGANEQFKSLEQERLLSDVIFGEHSGKPTDQPAAKA